MHVGDPIGGLREERLDADRDTCGPGPVRTWAAYPLGQVEMLEAAASVLKAVAHQHQLRVDLSHDRRLVKRFELALAECELMLETLTES